MLKFAVDDFKIDPKAIGTYFEFFVAAQLCWIRLQENFGDIAVPKFIAATIRVSIIKDGDETIAGDKFQVKKFVGPQEANFGLAMWIGVIFLPVSVKEYGFCASPRFGRWKSGNIE
jgi:hypothetical protein